MTAKTMTSLDIPPARAAICTCRSGDVEKHATLAGPGRGFGAENGKGDRSRPFASADGSATGDGSIRERSADAPRSRCTGASCDE
jgi:hypothetical protein